MAVLWVLTLASMFAFTLASITNSSVSPTPPMGYNSWARYFGKFDDEKLYRDTADAMVSKGLLKVGYNRINIDDAWMKTSREADGSLLWNATLYPSGMPSLVKYFKSKGFRFGIYSNAGNVTCAGYPGSYGHEETDIKTFDSWGVEYVKLDGCNVYPNPGSTLEQKYKEIYGKWHEILSTTSNHMVFSESAPAYFSGDTFFKPQNNASDWHHAMSWAPLFGELARHSNDIAVYAYVKYDAPFFWESIISNYKHNLKLARYQRPGFYNDPDFLIADNLNLTIHEKRSQFAIWSSFSAPLMISANVSNIPDDMITALTNPEIIAVNQDPLGIQATIVSQDGTIDILTKDLSNGDRLLTVLNRRNKTSLTTIPIDRIGLLDDTAYTARDLWTGKEMSVEDNIDLTLEPHATAIYRFVNPFRAHAIPTGMIFNSATMMCLTARHDSVASFESCQGLDTQVWRASSPGKYSPLSGKTSCLDFGKDDAGKETLILQKCDPGSKSQNWVYQLSGNLRNEGKSQCVTMQGAQANLEECGDVLDTQVYGLPSGVSVEKDGVPA